MTKLEELISDIFVDAGTACGVCALMENDDIPAADSLEDAKNLNEVLDDIIFNAAQAKNLLKPFINRIHARGQNGEHLI